MSKRGLSTIITTLIMILLTLVAVGMIWLVVMNILKSSAEDINIGKFTIDLDIKSVQIDNNNVMIKIKRNVGAGEISGLKFAVSDGFNISVYEETTNIKELEEKTYILNYDGGLVKSVSIAPILKTSSGKEKTGNIVAEKEFSNKEIIQNLGAVSWWRFEGNANDEIGNNHGTLTNGVDCNVQGKYGKACKFDGEDDYLNMGNDTSIYSLSKSMSVSAIVKFSGFLPWRGIVSTGYDTSWCLGTYGHDIPEGRSFSFRAYNGTSPPGDKYVKTPNDFSSLDTWYHVVTTFDGSDNKIRLYINGSLIDEITNAPDVLPSINYLRGYNNIYIGARDSLDGHINGTIDEVMIFNRALSVNEVKAIYNLDLS